MLEPYFNPRSVAVIGASSNPNKLGHSIIRNLIEYGYRDAIYPINPRAGEILGQACYGQVADVPDPLDLAVIILPAPLVAGALEQCGRRGIGHAIVVSGGFGETGPDGQAAEQVLLEIAHRYQLRLMGPNCVGTIDTHTPLNTTFIAGMPQRGDIGFVTQSGAMCAVVIDWARGAGVGFSRIVSLGNQVDVSIAEVLSSLAGDPHTRVLTAYIEGVVDGRAFMEAAEAAARRKPVVVLKGGHGEGGARAVASHTGALAGSAEAYDAAFERCGVLRANSMEALFDWARALAWQPLPEGDRVAVLTNAGGPGILAVDALESAGLKLALLSGETRTYLESRLPPACSTDNPVDILAGSGPGTYAIALEALLSDPNVDAVLVIQAPQDWFLPESLAEVVTEISAAYRKPVLASIMGLASTDEALAILNRHRVPNFTFPERAAPALAAMMARRRWLETPAGVDGPPLELDRQAAAKALARQDFASALAAYGIRLPSTRPAATAEEAVRQAQVIGYPVALKLDSVDISHKSDLGGVRLDLADAAAVRAAFEEIIYRAREASPEARIDGVLVQQMLAGGEELIVGVRRDPQFGPLALVGSGGIEVELQRDVALGIAPLSEDQAERLLDDTLAGTRLQGWRGRPAADRQAVIQALRRLAQIACDFPAIIELEINPLYVLTAGQGAYAVDIRGALDHPPD